MTAVSAGFNAAYNTMQANVEKLGMQGNLDIDSLVPIVGEGAAAYRIGKERIAVVRILLQGHLKDEATPT